MLASGPTAGVAYAAGSFGVRKTTDFGDTWISLDSAPSGVAALAVDPRDSRIVYVGGAFGLSHSVDGGPSWTALPGFPGGASLITFDPGPPLLILAAQSLTHQVFASVDGAQWTSKGPLPVNAKILSVASDHRLLVGDEYSGLKLLAAGALSDASSGMSAFSVPVIWSDPRVPSLVLASAQSRPIGGIYRSTDAAFHWDFVQNGYGAFSIAGDSSDPDRLVAISSDTVIRSLDGGETWTASDAGLLLGYPYSMTALAADLHHGGTFYAATGKNTFGFILQPTFYRSTDFGATWSMASGPNAFRFDTTIIAISPDPAEDGTLWIDGAHSVFVSRDGGLTWTTSETRPYFLGATLDKRSPGTAYRSSSDGVEVTRNAGVSWSLLARGLRGGPSTVRSIAIDYSQPNSVFAGTDHGVYQFSVVGNPSQCADSATSLCLQGGRFRVEATFTANSSSAMSALASPIAADTGTLRFFSDENLELMVKVLDGRTVNGNFWVFLGALSNVEYTVTVTDMESGAVWSHDNPQGVVASVADTGAFPGSGEVEAPDNPPPGFGPASEGPSPCGGSAVRSLCFLNGRFRAEAVWNAPSIGTGSAVAVPLTGVSGAMWFFSSNNLELILKVVDGRAVNGKFWVFVGGLTDVEYDLTITDTQTGAVWTRHNAANELASVADAAAF